MILDSFLLDCITCYYFWLSKFTTHLHNTLFTHHKIIASYRTLFLYAALGDIGVLNDNIQSAIIWAVRFENEPGVRAEACRTLVRVQIRGSEVAGLLQDKLLVEPDDMVRE